MEIQSVAICGMGALGLLYGTHILDHGGEVSYVMDPARLETYTGRTFYKNGVPYRPPMRSGTETGPVDLLIVAVKSTALDSAMEVMAPCVGPKTILLSVLNGITSEEILAQRFGKEHLIYAVALGMDAVKQADRLTFSKMGELRIGAREPCQAENVRTVAAYFDRIAMPYAVETDIWRRLWSKLIANVGANQACMVFRTNYGGCMDLTSEAYRTMVAAMREVIAVAQCEGIPLGEADLNAHMALIATFDPEAMPSMRQDALAHRPSEVELFSGTIRRLAQKHGLLVPANDFFYRQIQAIEATY